MKNSAACHHCHGSGVERPGLDPAVVPLIAAAVGGRDFTTRQLQDNARIAGGALAVALADFDGQRLGIALGALCGLLIDGCTLTKIGLDRRHVTLWQIYMRD